MTTPRVTVPVEPIQRLILAADSYGARYLDSDDMSAEAEELQAATETMKDLIAAPAPEGGVVDASAILEMAAKAIEDHQKEGREWIKGSLWDDLTREAAGRIRALKSALATREEAPADAGEDLVSAIDAFMPSAEVAFLWTKETPPADEVQRYRERYWAVKEALLRLRAQPPAREDAQPVDDKPLTKSQRSQLFHILRSGSAEVSGSWAAFDALATRGLIHISEYRIGFYRARATEKALAAYGSELGINTLAIHPAPDALRDAMAAIRAEINAPLTGPAHGAWDRGRIAGLKEAVAALRAEQKGGA